MTAAWHAVTSPWGVACLLAYLVLVVLVLCANHAAHRKPTPTPDDTQRAVYPPPVPAPVTPPFTQAIPDASWFAGMPVGILSDDAVHSLFDRLVSMDDNLRDLA